MSKLKFKKETISEFDQSMVRGGNEWITIPVTTIVSLLTYDRVDRDDAGGGGSNAGSQDTNGLCNP